MATKLKFSKKIDSTVVINAKMPARRIEHKGDLELELDQLEDYCFGRKRNSLSKTTVKNYKAATKAIFNKLGYLEYSDQYVSMVRRAIEGKPSNTVFLYMTALQELFRANYLEDYEIAKPKVTRNCTNDENKYHKPQEIVRLFEAIGTDTLYNCRDSAIISLLYFAALRNSEVCHLEVGDYDLENHFVTIHEHGKWHPKSYQVRKLYVPKECHAKILAWYKVREQENITSKTLFLTSNGVPFNDLSLRNVIVRRAKDAGLKTYPHKLRHSRATHLANGINGNKPWAIGVLSKYLGHSSISTTAIYVHTSDEEQKRYLDMTKELNV
ncbi:putative site-specific recombinase [Methanocella paludicola SANAE]|uniref:Site-specific recombinase n=1 Tax=Methanocella paludicola (strain DSM 17711 / JCM 13418 / NBRC 101707 / SANAE) TaxID=304371 RepID=D1Z0L8_METPS|nr:site-specific integrase [Methanocella paludicola]BAI62240.1 putative site-specific recombinase [Methanocella paludicola SANAE]